MENNISKQIRMHRLRCNLTQEKLAEALNISSQAVSKWENGLSYPDITLLPELSAVLGITVDALFASGEETHYQRIERMIENEYDLSREDFDYAERFLTESSVKIESRGRALTMLGELYNHAARMYRAKAAEVAKQALEIAPDEHNNHAILCEAMNGVFIDWSITNHIEIIDYYKAFIKKNPHYRGGYMWLIDNLVADGRFAEAEETLEALHRIKDTYHYLFYKGYIAWKAEGFEKALPYFDQMVNTFPENWHVWTERGTMYAKNGMYEKAIEDYRKSAELETGRRFTDNYESIAQLSLLLGKKKDAAAAYEKVVEIMRNDWGMQEGDTIKHYLKKIDELKNTSEDPCA